MGHLALVEAVDEAVPAEVGVNGKHRDRLRVASKSSQTPLGSGAEEMIKVRGNMSS